MKKIRFVTVLLIIFLPMFLRHPSAQKLAGTEWPVSHSGIDSVEMLFDGELEEATHCEDGASLTFSAQDGLQGIYLIFDREYDSLTLSSGADRAEVRLDGILHAYIDLVQYLPNASGEVTLVFSSGEAEVNEVACFSPGELPDWVQRWERIGDGEADLLLLSTHGDDEQLFFAGLLPWYAAEQGKRVQVVYFTDHRNLTSHRVHEMLNGLWAVGVRDYPVFGHFSDYYTFDMEDAYRYYEEQGFSREKLLSFVVENLRRYRPLVAVGHDEKGEYGHGMHQLTADLLKQAVQLSGDGELFPDSAEKYGAWDVPKTYLHLYGENPITMDWDIPMDCFDGKTAYQVSKDLGFPSHVSQVADFAWYFRGADTAAEVEKYNPCLYGLYRTTVGADTENGDFFQNLEIYTQPTQATEPTQTFPAPTESTSPIVLQTQSQKFWPLIPAVGTAILALLMAGYERKRNRGNSG